MRAAAIVALVLALGMLATPAFAVTWHILPDGTGDAPTIQAGIDSAVAGDTVELACGIYGERDIRMKSGICLRSETGDPSCATIDGHDGARIIVCELVDNSASIIGITLTRGRASGDYPDHLGGGLFCMSSSPKVRSCIFVDNHATWGGGGLGILNPCSPNVADCVFESNTAGVHGGGIFYHDAAPHFDNCLVTGNAASGWGGGALAGSGSIGSFFDCVFSKNTADDGGGAYCNQAVTGFLGCTFERNTASQAGGGVAFYMADGPRARLVDCTILENQARTGGGVNCGISSPVISGCVVLRNQSQQHGGGIKLWEGSSPEITGCIIAENHALLKGGGITCEVGSDPVIRECTLYGNSANEEGSGLFMRSSSPEVENTIISFGTGEGAVLCSAQTYPTMACTDIFGNQGGDWGSCIADEPGSDGNIASDPLFCDAVSGDFTLDAASPCLDVPGCGQIGAFGQGCDVVTGVVGASQEIRAHLFLSHNVPNPFNPSTSIQFTVPKRSEIDLTLYDTSGRRVAGLASGTYEAGEHTISWNGIDEGGREVPSGTYFARLHAGEYTAVRKMVLLR